jgi:predicted nucleotidyltransferase
MRTQSALDPLFSRTTQQILAAILLERNEPWYFSDLAKRLRRTPSTLQRPLDSLVRAGIVRRWAEGNRVYFGREPDCPFLPELQGILVKTVGLVEILREELRPTADKIRIAFVYGSVAKGQERAESDVDIMVIGAATLSDLSPSLHKAEKRLGRPVNATVFPPREFSAKIERKNHFLRSVLAAEKIFVLGSEHELEELKESGKSRPARHKQSGTRRSARRR